MYEGEPHQKKGKKMKKALAIVLLVALFVTVALACGPIPVTCPIDNTNSAFTGRTVVIDGVPMCYFRCERGHEFLVRCGP